MNSIQKKELLSRNIWTIKEVKNYFNITNNKWAKLSPYLTVRPPFSASVYRDDVFNLLGTSVEKEAKILNSIGGF